MHIQYEIDWEPFYNKRWLEVKIKWEFHKYEFLMAEHNTHWTTISPSHVIYVIQNAMFLSHRHV